MTSEEIIEDTNKGAARFAAHLKEPVYPTIVAEVEHRLAFVGDKTTEKSC